MSLITIEQLLESVDLDFEPRFVTKDEDGEICIYSDKPRLFVTGKLWQCVDGVCHNIGRFKLSEFEKKDCPECIYEVPRKTTGNEIEQKMLAELERKLNAIVDAAIEAVNELKENKGV